MLSDVNADGYLVIHGISSANNFCLCSVVLDVALIIFFHLYFSLMYLTNLNGHDSTNMNHVL